ncbi:hypothetical protein GCM10009761_32120 [Agromyces terreus]
MEPHYEGQEAKEEGLCGALRLYPGIVLGMISAIRTMRHPRKKGEPFSRTRWIMVALAILGAVLCIAIFVVVLLD